jgi:hypothetical protein
MALPIYILFKFTCSVGWILSLSLVSCPAQPISHAEILARAAVEKKPVLVLLSGTWDKESETLIAKTFSDTPLQSWVTQHALTSAIDVFCAPELTRAHHIRIVPTLLLLGSNGEELDRWTTLPKPSALLSDLQAALAGKNSTSKARAKLDADDLKGHFELARRCDAEGRYSAALEQYEYMLAYLDVLHKKPTNLLIAVPHALEIYSDLGSLAKRYPLAVDVLRRNRAKHVSATLAQPDQNSDDAYAAVSIDLLLDEPDAILAFFHQLPEESQAHRHIKPEVFEILVARRAYREAAALISADELIELRGDRITPRQASSIAARIATQPKPGEHLVDQRRRLMAKWGSYFSAFAALEDRENSRTLARFIFDHDRDAYAPALLTSKAKRVLKSRAEHFLRSLDMPLLPAPSLVITSARVETLPVDKLGDNDSPDVVELSPLVVTEKAGGIHPFIRTWQTGLFSRRVKNPVIITQVSDLIRDRLKPGERLLAINGRLVTTFKSDDFLKLRFSGEAGDPVTLVIQGQGSEDAVYREITVPRFSNAKLKAHPPKR